MVVIFNASITSNEWIKGFVVKLLTVGLFLTLNRVYIFKPRSFFVKHRYLATLQHTVYTIQNQVVKFSWFYSLFSYINYLLRNFYLRVGFLNNIWIVTCILQNYCAIAALNYMNGKLVFLNNTIQQYCKHYFAVLPDICD